MSIEELLAKNGVKAKDAGGKKHSLGIRILLTTRKPGLVAVDSRDGTLTR